MMDKSKEEIIILLNIIDDMSNYIMMLKKVKEIELPQSRLETLQSYYD